MNNKIVRIGALCVLMTTCAFAQQKDSLITKNEKKFDFVDKAIGIPIKDLDEVVISDSKFALAKEKSGKVITKITSEDLKNNAGQSIATILNSVAGVEINGNQSAAGKNLGYYIRGGKNKQVLILIDGIPVTDASGISFEYDLRLLPADQVESIEIMKGAASTLYGSGAATGVINITLKKSGKKAIQGNAYINAGTNNTAFTSKTGLQDFNQGFSVNGNVKKVNYFASLNSTETNGMSQIAPPNANVSYESDRFSRINYLAKLGYKATDKLALDFFGNFDKINNDYDAGFDNTGSNDTNLNYSKSEQFRFGFTPKYKYTKGEFVMNSSFNKIVRSYHDFNSYSKTVGFSQYESRSVNVDAYNKYEVAKSLFLVTGTQYQFFDMNSGTPYGNIAKENAKFNMIDPYITGVFTSDFGLNVNAGARLNIHSEYGNQLVYNLNPSYDFKSIPLKILASYSTAFVTPSLYQLYSEYGNKSLTPEKNSTIEGGFETQLLDKKFRLNVVGFYREQNNFIGFYYNPVTYKGNYTNIDGTNKAKGIEMEIAFALSEKIKWNSNYTYTQVDEALNRLIPKHKVNSSLDFQINKRAFFNVNYQYVDSRKDAFFDGNSYKTQNVVLGSYQLVNASIRYELVKNRLSIFGAATNILNANFVENVGYSTLGRNFKLGLNINL
ncbi:MULTISPECIES: TonB-dependent receptor plug domain-containing protein [unclassified Flavobacterium]|jgi:vitamin B12 transporter|uniref:TonB-dependent receptor plug domain-containing protein n=1 Tax=unclassified Flavobacterium TaxID=196869 RepID=UPI0025BFAD5C|nr:MULTISPECIES: TonB-dependent receptor plug domain-containing protein [unclassified Flavobacterium]